MSNFLSKVKELTEQVANLRYLAIGLSVVVCVQGIGIMFLSLRPPLVFEQSDSKTVLAKNVNGAAREIEVKNFVRLALNQRLNSDADSLDLISEVERDKRRAEQDELKKRDLLQSVLVEQVDLSDGKVRVAVTRILSVGKIRSAFPAVIDVEIEETSRSSKNPYGLILVGAKSSGDQKEGKDK